jgi:hypothetical protein
MATVLPAWIMDTDAESMAMSSSLYTLCPPAGMHFYPCFEMAKYLQSGMGWQNAHLEW